MRMKLFFQTNDPAYEASLVTRDRALAAKQESIDILRRMLKQMEDDPLIESARASLSEILKNPEIIDDEVFGNIMSKTQEVMDASFDAQVEQFLDTARSRGVTGDTIAIQLQKAKNARAQGMAAAYRDAIIERSKQGLKTSFDAINTAFSAVNAHNANKLRATEDLVNVHQSIVPEPFRNPGLPSGANPSGAGISGGGYSGRPITYDFGGTFMDKPLGERGFGSFGNEPDPNMIGQVSGAGGKTVKGTLTDAERLGTTPEGLAAREKQMAAAEAATRRIDVSDPSDPSQIVSGVRQQGGVEPGTRPEASDAMTAYQRQLQQLDNRTQAPVNLNTANLSETMKAAAQDGLNNAMNYSPLNSVGVPVRTPQGFNQSYTPSYKPGVPQTTYNISGQGSYLTAGDRDASAANMTTLTGSGLPQSGVTMGGGADEAKRVADMIGTPNQQTGSIISPDQIIGTTAGGGVRKLATPYQDPYPYHRIYKNVGLDPNGEPIILSVVVKKSQDAASYKGSWGGRALPQDRALLQKFDAASRQNALTQRRKRSGKLRDKITVSNPYGEGTVQGVRT